MNKKEFYEKIRIDENGNPQIEEHVRAGAREFYKLHPNSTIEWLFRSEEAVRTLKMNRYYWAGILSVFCPAHFQTPVEAHEYFSKEYLSEEDIVNIKEDNLSEILSIISKNISHTKPLITQNRIDEFTLCLNWVRSTTTLTKKRMSQHIKDIILEGQELGLEFEDIDKFDEYKSQR